MNRYLTGNFDGDAFKLFSTPHLMALLTIIIFNVLIFINRDKIKEERVNKYFRYTLAALLIIQELSYNAWNIYVGEWSLGSTLPLHLCGASVILSATMLIRKKFSIYEIVYFWGVGGASQALLTPDIGIYGFPHYRFYQFFVSHGAIVTACLFATFTFDFRPTIKSLWKAVGVLNIYMIFIALVNIFTGGNYLFIRSKPATASLMDYLGPWPWYILALEVLAVVMFFIIYIPFKLSGLFRKKDTAYVDTM